MPIIDQIYAYLSLLPGYFATFGGYIAPYVASFIAVISSPAVIKAAIICAMAATAFFLLKTVATGLSTSFSTLKNWFSSDKNKAPNAVEMVSPPAYTALPAQAPIASEPGALTLRGDHNSIMGHTLSPLPPAYADTAYVPSSILPMPGRVSITLKPDQFIASSRSQIDVIELGGMQQSLQGLATSINTGLMSSLTLDATDGRQYALAARYNAQDDSIVLCKRPLNGKPGEGITVISKAESNIWRAQIACAFVDLAYSQGHQPSYSGFAYGSLAVQAYKKPVASAPPIEGQAPRQSMYPSLNRL